MRNLVSLTALFLSFFSYTTLNAQCGATSVTADPQPVMVCEGNATTINFSSTGTCAGTFEYEVLLGATILQAWSATASYNASPLTTTTYTVNARCSACPGTVVSATFEVNVVEEPTITGDLVVCPGTTTTLTASGSTGIFEWWDANPGVTQLSASGVYTSPTLNADVTYWIQATGSIAGGGGSVLITECGLDGAIGGTGSEDYIEISNLYTTPVNTTGWVCAVSNSYSNINTFNSILWNLPASFAPCSVVTRTDVSGTPNYWGNNIFWNSTSSSWAIIIDDVGNVVDFIAWGWTAAQLATFNPTINGFPITLGAQWVGDGCALPCGSTGGVQYSYARTGSTDNNTAGDFVCQPTSVDVINPGLSCGWSAGVACPWPVTVVIDLPPTASNPVNINVECYADVPVPNINAVFDENDDVTLNPIVTFIAEVSDGLSCPETITRTYRVTDDCGSFIDVMQTIVINDITPPVASNLPPETGTPPAPDPLVVVGETDNCGAPIVSFISDVSDNGNCPEIITRTYRVTDLCGNFVDVTQIFTIGPSTGPIIDAGLDQTICMGDAITLTAVNPSNAVLFWDNSVIDNLPFSPIGTMTYTVTAGGTGCISTDQVTITVEQYPVLTFMADTLSGCNPLMVIFTNTTVGNTLNCIWDINGTQLNGCNDVTYVFNSAGLYDITLTSTSINGCTISETYSDYIYVDQTPSASFNTSSTAIDNFISEVSFENTSINANNYTWDMGDGTTGTEISPTHTFPSSSSAIFLVELVAHSISGACTDTAWATITLNEEVIYYVPNAFTPDDDDYNPTFKPIFTAGYDPFDFTLLIFNRWGETIFESHDSAFGWDGTYGGRIVPDGTYSWAIEFKTTATDKRVAISGHVSLLR